MNMMNADFIHNARRQRGAALLTGLIFMVILTLLGITAARMAGLEERMSGNMRDRSLAMQAAERALRDAEQDILTSGRVSLTKSVAACTAGLCYNGKTGNSNGVDWNTTPIWTTINMTAAPSVAYGTYTGAAAITGISAPPRYILEGMEKFCWKECESEMTPGYRITVRAQGANPNTVVWLQEIYKP
jgi:type IV pilus assembly protein PilX